MSVASTRQRPELRPSRASRGGGPGEKLVQEEKDGRGQRVKKTSWESSRLEIQVRIVSM